MTLLETLYSIAASAARPLLPAVGAASPKLAAATAGRRMAVPAIRDWAHRERDPRRPLIWLHGASAGELGGAAPVLGQLRERRPDLQSLVTYSSPSASRAATALGADYAGYVPLDTRRDCRDAIRLVAPTTVVFAKLDVWPNLARAAAQAGVPLALVNATLRPRSSRLRAAGRSLLGPTYRRLDRVGAISAADAERLVRLGVRPAAVRVTGDAAFEEALARADRGRARVAAGEPRLPPRSRGAVRLVAGSTWPRDEDLLLRSVGRRQEGWPPVELVVVPHEPDEPAVRRLAEVCRAVLGVDARLWSAMETPDAPGPGGGVVAGDAGGGGPRPLVVDRVGLLAELYVEGDLAYVGGGFGRSGLHSVVEPAAAGLPVLFGPRHDRREADDLLELGAAREIREENAIEVLGAWLADPAAREQAASRARAYAESGRSAAAAGADLVEELLASRISRSSASS